MSEIDELRSRVEEAVDKLSSSYDARREQNQTLTQFLAELEQKFNARTEELEHCNQRIDALGRDNAELSQLIERLVLMIDGDPSGEQDDPIFRASNMARELLQSWSSEDETEGSATEDVSSPSHDAMLDEQPGIDDVEEAAEIAFGGSTFEDVSEEELASEQQTIEAENIPDEVSQAITAALNLNDDDAGSEQPAVMEQESAMPDIEALLEEAEELLDVDELVDAVAADLDIAKSDAEMAETGPENETTEASIREMMERLEKAAAKSLGGGSNSDDEIEIDPESSERVA